MPFLTQGKTNWKFLLIVVFLAFLAGGGVLWFTLKQDILLTEFPEIKIHKDETADWKTYKNEEYGFEVKYPEFLKVEHVKRQDEYFFIRLLPGKSNLTIWSQSRSYDFSKYLEIYRPLEAEPVGKVTIGGKEAIKFFTTNPVPPTIEALAEMPIEAIEEQREELASFSLFIDYFIILDKYRCIEIQYRGMEGEKEMPDIFNQILSTLRFLD